MRQHGIRLDWETTLRHLDRAERTIVEAREHIVRQERHIAELERRGQKTSEARAVLRDFHQIRAMHEADRTRLRRALETDADE